MQYTDIRFPHLGIVLSHVGRYISIGNFQIMFYGIIIACGFLAGLVVAQQEAKRTGQNPEIYMDYLKVPIPSAIKMTEEEYNMRAVYESTLQNYVETAERSFIVGDSGYDVESDTDWNAYVQRLVGYRCDDLLKCYNDALARYKQSKS